MDNMTLLIDPATHDLVLDSDGHLVMIEGDATSAQCVRLTLEVFKGCWFLDLRHGTDYDRIMGLSPTDKEIADVVREGIYQETDVRHVESLTVSRDVRRANVQFSGSLRSGREITLEVTADE